YHYRAVEAHDVLQIHCWANTYRPDEELSVAVYTEDAAGKRVRVHDESPFSADRRNSSGPRR
ncbi:MAG: hypothetical protein HGB17_12230, partial [Syntrophobacteraceae bacterium]|nr:hypothetical protein [Syntrophobacteraceae bacterium]